MRERVPQAPVDARKAKGSRSQNARTHGLFALISLADSDHRVSAIQHELVGGVAITGKVLDAALHAARALMHLVDIKSVRQAMMNDLLHSHSATEQFDAWLANYIRLPTPTKALRMKVTDETADAAMASLGPRKDELRYWRDRMLEELNMSEAERRFEALNATILDRKRQLARLEGYERKAYSRFLSAIRELDLARIEASREADQCKQ